MSRIRTRRPSPALIVAVIALVVAMAGTGYAASQLPKNSVGTKQLKRNAVTGVKVADGSLTGKDINLASLGPVPASASAGHAASADSASHATTAGSAAHATSSDSAGHATTADSANSIPPAGPIRLVGAPGEPPFLSGSATRVFPEAGVSYQPVGFFKDHEGVVHLEGVAVAGKEGSTPGLIFILPPGYRPAANTVLAFEPAEKRGILIGGAGAHVGPTDLSGVVYAPETEAGAIPLSGITFLAQG